VARPVNRTILLSQKLAATRHPSGSPKKNTLTDSQKRWVERLATQTSFGGPDSKRFAFNLQPGKAYQTVQFYQFDGNTWRKLDSLESNAATYAPLDPAMARQEKKLKLRADWPFLTSWQVRKWIAQALRFYMPVRLKLSKSETKRKR